MILSQISILNLEYINFIRELSIVPYKRILCLHPLKKLVNEAWPSMALTLLIDRLLLEEFSWRNLIILEWKSVWKLKKSLC